MVNPFKEVDWQPDTKARRAFARSLVIGFPCLALLFLTVNRIRTGAWHLEFPLYLAAIGAGVGVLLWIAPGIARPFYFAWYALACTIGLIVGNLVLGLVFYLLMTGIALVMRLWGRQYLRKSPDSHEKSYWIDSRQSHDYYRQF